MQELWTPWDLTFSSLRSCYMLQPVPRVALVGGGRKTRLSQRSGLLQRPQKNATMDLAENNPALILLLPTNSRSDFAVFTWITTGGGCTVFILSLILIFLFWGAITPNTFFSFYIGKITPACFTISLTRGAHWFTTMWFGGGPKSAACMSNSTRHTPLTHTFRSVYVCVCRF